MLCIFALSKTIKTTFMKLVNEKTPYFIVPIYDNPDGWNAFLLDLTTPKIAELKKCDSVAQTAIDSLGLALCSIEIEMPIGNFLSVDAGEGGFFKDWLDDEELKYLAATPEEIEALVNKPDAREICQRSIRFYGYGNYPFV